MRFVIITRPLFSVPSDQLPGLMERFVDWRERYRDRMESFEFFAGGGGGFMVVDIPDEVMLNQMMAEYPLIAYLDVEVRPIIDGDTGLGQWWQVMRQMLGDAVPPEGLMGSEATPTLGEVGEEPPAEPPPDARREPPPPGPPPDADPLA